MPTLGLDAIANLETPRIAKVGIANRAYWLFLLTTAVMPLASLFWNVNFFWVKANWLPYPIFLIAVIFVMLCKKSVPKEFVCLIFFAAFYLALSYFNDGDAESIGRFTITILPLTFYFMFDDIKDTNHRYFWWIYGALMIIPIFNSYLQYTGKIPYDEFDYVGGEKIGRMSGGYQKPHNLVAYLVPIFLLGLYLWKVKQRKLIGILVVFAVLFWVYMIGYRTSLIAFLTILVSSFFMRTTQRLIYTYYHYFLNFFVPILAFIFSRLLLSTVGLWDKLRGRVPIWELHSWQFFDQNPFNILFGSQKVMIEDNYLDSSVYLIDEVHNNSFRTMIVFGLFGFFLYCFVMRKIVLHLQNRNYGDSLKFIMFSCFTYFIFYTITNEPLYHGSVLWPVLIWIFLVQSMPSKWKNSSDQS
jgi:hypothetical protein